MFNQNVYKILLVLLSALNLTACSSSDNNNYKALINEYEERLAEEQVDESIELARKISTEQYPEERLITFMSFPIPTHYKPLHASLGIDVSKLNYQDTQWVGEIKSLEQAERKFTDENPQVEEDHAGHGH